MRVKLLRSIGRNIFEAHRPLDDEGDGIKAALDKDAPWAEGQVRETDDKTAHYLIRNMLAEETTEDVTKLPPKVTGPAPKVTPVPSPKIPPKEEHK